MNKQTLKKYYKNTRSSLINSYVIIGDDPFKELYITNQVSIIAPKQTLKNGIKIDSLNYSIKKYVDTFKGGKFRALDLNNYTQTCDLISYTKDKSYIKEHKEHDIGGGFSIDLQLLKTCCDLIHATSASIVDLEDAGHPVIFIKNQKTGAHGWLLPCKVY